MGRFDRQIGLFGYEGQRKISEATVGIAGCGGLGVNAATSLAMAGVRHFVICDPDVPEESNLNRQYVYAESVGDGRPKAEILAEWIRTRSPGAEVDVRVCTFEEDPDMFGGCDVVLDCLDTIGSRMNLNRYCVAKEIRMIHGGADGTIGEIAVIVPGESPCLRCMLGDVPETEHTSVGSVVATVGSMQATEAIKILLGIAEGTFLHMDLKNRKFTEIRFEKDENCPVCGKRPPSGGPFQ